MRFLYPLGYLLLILYRVHTVICACYCNLECGILLRVLVGRLEELFGSFQVARHEFEITLANVVVGVLCIRCHTLAEIVGGLGVLAFHD